MTPTPQPDTSDPVVKGAYLLQNALDYPDGTRGSANELNGWVRTCREQARWILAHAAAPKLGAEVEEIEKRHEHDEGRRCYINGSVQMLNEALDDAHADRATLLRILRSGDHGAGSK